MGFFLRKNTYAHKKLGDINLHKEMSEDSFAKVQQRNWLLVPWTSFLTPTDLMEEISLLRSVAIQGLLGGTVS